MIRWLTRYNQIRLGAGFIVCLALWGVVPHAHIAVAANGHERLTIEKPDDVFGDTKIWSIHLAFTPDQWEAMDPKQGGFGPFDFGGGPARGDTPGGRSPGEGGRSFGPPRGPDFGPGIFLAPALVRHGDANQDGKLSKDEFVAVGSKWFEQWDAKKTGTLKADDIRSGLNQVLAPPGGRDGARNAPARGGFTFNLQGPEGKRNGIASAMGVEFSYVRAELDFAGQVFDEVGVRYKGNGTFLESRGALKRPLKIDLNEFGKDQKLAGMSQLNLHNNVTDPSWMNEVLSYRLFRDAGVPASRTAYARVFITVPNLHDRKYVGLYSLVEDVAKQFLKDNFGSAKGAIFKPVTPKMFDYLGDDWKSYNQTYDPKSDVTPDQKKRLIEFCKFVTQADDAEFAAKLGNYLEIDEFAKYMAVLVYLVDLDGILGPGQNVYLYLDPKTRRFQFIPWDLDHSFGQFAMRGTQEQREQLSIHRPWQGENRFLERVFQVTAFKEAYLARLKDFDRSLFKPERFQQQVDELASAIRPAVAEESPEKLERFDRAVAGELPSLPSFGFGPRFGQPTKPIKPFVLVRAKSVSDQLNGIAEGQTLEPFGFPGGGNRPGREQARPNEFGPGNFLSGGFLAAVDVDKDGGATRDELRQAMSQWFDDWKTPESDALSEDQVRNGLNKALAPPRSGPPGGASFGRRRPGAE